MDYLPIFLSLTGKTVLLAGDGAPVTGKLMLVRRAGARVLLLAAAPGAELRAAIQRDCQVTWERRAFTPDDVDGKALVIALLDDAGNRLIAAAARARSVPVNIIDRPDLSSVIMPAIVDRSPVIIAVGTSGAAPALAARLRRQIEALLPLNLGWLAEFARDWRPQVGYALPGHDQRRRFWRRWFDGPGAAALLAGREAEAHDSLARDLAAIDPCPPSATVE